MAPLPTAAPRSHVGPAQGNAQGAGPSAEGLANGPIAHRLVAHRVSPQGTTRSKKIVYKICVDFMKISSKSGGCASKTISRNLTVSVTKFWHKVNRRTKAGRRPSFNYYNSREAGRFEVAYTGEVW